MAVPPSERVPGLLSPNVRPTAGLVFRYRVCERTYTARQGTQRKRKCRSHDILFSLAVVELVVHQPAQRRVRVHASDAHHAVRLVDAELGTTLADSRQPTARDAHRPPCSCPTKKLRIVASSPGTGTHSDGGTTMMRLSTMSTE